MMHSTSQKSTLAAILLLFISVPFSNLFAQCLNSSVWGGNGAPTTSEPAIISDCNYAGEYASVSNIEQGQSYVATSSNCLDYITIYSEGGTMIAFGQTPLAFEATAEGNYSFHFNTDENCGSEGACRLTSIHCVGCGATAGCTNEVATNYDENATYDDCSCILPNLPNDDCAGAISLDAWLNVDGTCTMTSTTTYSGATETTNEIAPSVECADGDLSPKDVWYSVTVPSSGVVAFTFVNTPGFSSVVECYTGSCGALVAYAPVLCTSEDERTFVGLTPGETVFFRVWDYGSNDIGNHELCVRGEVLGCTDPEALNYNPSATYDDGSCNYPSASKPCTANILTVNGPCVVGDNTALGMEPGEPVPSCYVGENNAVWFKFIAQSNYSTISTDFTGYTHADTEISLYSVGSCFNYATYTSIACDQDGGQSEDYNSVIANAPTTIGQVYYIQISGWNGAQGTFCLQVTSPPANNEICGAEAISCGDVKTSNTGLYSLSENNMPLDGCGTPLSSSNAFYVLVGTGNDVNLSLCNSGFDTRLNVYCLQNGDCNGTPEFVCVGSNDDSPTCANTTISEISFATESAKKYYVMVHGYGNNTGPFELGVACNTTVIKPANQDCTNDGSACREMGTAEVLVVEAACNPVNGTTKGAASIIKNPTCVSSVYQTYSSVWYKLNSGEFTAFNIALENDNGIDLRQSFHTACEAEPIFCDESTVYGLTENTDYYIQVFTPQSDEGDFTICAQPVEVCAFLSSPSGEEVDVNTLLEWTATPSANGYKLMIGTTSGNDDFMLTTDVGNTTSYEGLTFDYNTTYYVTIIPYDDNGDIETCPGFEFKTTCPNINTELMSLLENDCLGTADGGIDIEVAGGVGPYEFEWIGPNGYTNATEDIVQVAAGDYTVIISDMDNGCETETNFEIPTAEPMTATFNTVGQACANDGSAEVVPTSGEAPYTYLWNNGATTAQIENMPAGTYEVAVTDATGCIAEYDEIIIENTGGVQSAIANIAGVGCGSTDGSITLSPQNGEAPYTYNWISLNGNTEGETTNIDGSYAIDELPLGTYNITITDANGCNGAVSLVTVPVIGELEPETALIENVTCNNTNNGRIEIVSDLGSAPFQFNWSNGETFNSQTGSSMIEDLSGGMYSVTVTDANGCVGIKTNIEVFEPNSLNLSIAGIDDAICFGDLTGGVKTLVEGGVPPYSFEWSNGSTTSDLVDAAFGNYSVTVNDFNGCQATSTTVTISSATEIEFDVNSTPTLACHGDNNGTINMNLFGGTPPYSIEWNNGETTASLTGLSDGDYQCTIVDSKGCTKMTEVYTIEAPEESVTLEVDNIDVTSCPDMEDGSINVTVSGGTAPYNYNWSSGETTEDLTNLTTGTYTVTVTDANNCEGNLTVNISNSGDISINLSSTTPTCATNT
ncbi:MAG: SprB repeat-containing protein, partial [Saprospiraceae bacterium]